MSGSPIPPAHLVRNEHDILRLYFRQRDDLGLCAEEADGPRFASLVMRGAEDVLFIVGFMPP
jgi:hypothetical protein